MKLTILLSTEIYTQYYRRLFGIFNNTKSCAKLEKNEKKKAEDQEKYEQ